MYKLTDSQRRKLTLPYAKYNEPVIQRSTTDEESDVPDDCSAENEMPRHSVSGNRAASLNPKQDTVKDKRCTDTISKSSVMDTGDFGKSKTSSPCAGKEKYSVHSDSDETCYYQSENELKSDEELANSLPRTSRAVSFKQPSDSSKDLGSEAIPHLPDIVPSDSLPLHYDSRSIQDFSEDEHASHIVNINSQEQMESSLGENVQSNQLVSSCRQVENSPRDIDEMHTQLFGDVTYLTDIFDNEQPQPISHTMNIASGSSLQKVSEGPADELPPRVNSKESYDTSSDSSSSKSHSKIMFKMSRHSCDNETCVEETDFSCKVKEQGCVDIGRDKDTLQKTEKRKEEACRNEICSPSVSSKRAHQENSSESSDSDSYSYSSYTPSHEKSDPVSRRVVYQPKGLTNFKQMVRKYHIHYYCLYHYRYLHCFSDTE
ncbi:hypothetical protein SK128_014495 [Halocaridina rubra]|uniref:Uncharacterized protein n=1 Tax=Halocaridina rubra TaxID=373956 RepID=A0AAN8XFY4_HALRR